MSSGDLTATDQRLTARLQYQTARRSCGRTPAPAYIVEQFRASGRDFGSARVSDHLETSAALARQFRHITGTIKTKFFVREEHVVLGYALGSFIGLSIALNDQRHTHDLRVSIPPVQIHKSAGRLKPRQVSVRAWFGRHELSSSLPSDVGHELSTADAVSRVLQMTSIVLRRVWAELPFETYESAAQITAEVLARTIELPGQRYGVSAIESMVHPLEKGAPTTSYCAYVPKEHNDGGAPRGAQAPSVQYPSPDRGPDLPAESFGDLARDLEAEARGDGQDVLRSEKAS